MPIVHVLAGVLADPGGKVLLAQRPAGKAFAGRWEFPGGKLEEGESPRDALVRELREELGIDVLEAEPLLAVAHRYPDAPVRVLIDSWRVLRWSGTPQPLDGQGLRWCPVVELATADILEADRPIVTALRLPPLLVDGAAVRGAEITTYVTPDEVQPAAATHQLVGCIVGDLAGAREAAARGVDFLVVVASVEADAAAAISSIGVPWYLDEHVAASPAVSPTGRWRSRARR